MNGWHFTHVRPYILPIAFRHLTPVWPASETGMARTWMRRQQRKPSWGSASTWPGTTTSTHSTWVYRWGWVSCSLCCMVNLTSTTNCVFEYLMGSTIMRGERTYFEMWDWANFDFEICEMFNIIFEIVIIIEMWDWPISVFEIWDRTNFIFEIWEKHYFIYEIYWDWFIIWYEYWDWEWVMTSWDERQSIF